LVNQNIKLEQTTNVSTLRFLEYKLDLYTNKKYIHEHRACRLVKHIPDQNFINTILLTAALRSF